MRGEHEGGITVRTIGNRKTGRRGSIEGLLALLGAALLLPLAGGCREEGAAEQAGREIDEAVEDLGEGVDKAVEDSEEALRKMREGDQ